MIHSSKIRYKMQCWIWIKGKWCIVPNHVVRFSSWECFQNVCLTATKSPSPPAIDNENCWNASPRPFFSRNKWSLFHCWCLFCANWFGWKEVKRQMIILCAYKLNRRHMLYRAQPLFHTLLISSRECCVKVFVEPLSQVCITTASFSSTIDSKNR